jgi:hypothetical protein
MHNVTTTRDVDVARQLVADALQAVALDHHEDPDTVALAKVMSENVRGWTHTTRLREFLEGVSA